MGNRVWSNFIAAGEAGGVNTAYVQEQQSEILECMFAGSLDALRALNCPEQLQMGSPLTHPTALRSF